eukprot:gene5926-4238_t
MFHFILGKHVVLGGHAMNMCVRECEIAFVARRSDKYFSGDACFSLSFPFLFLSHSPTELLSLALRERDIAATLHRSRRCSPTDVFTFTASPTLRRTFLPTAALVNLLHYKLLSPPPFSTTMKANEDSGRWSMYSSESQFRASAEGDEEIPPFSAPFANCSLKDGAVVRLGEIARGSQGVLYLARDVLDPQNPRRVAVKRLYTRENPYGNIGIDPLVLRETTMLNYVCAQQRKSSAAAIRHDDSDAGRDAVVTMDRSAGVVELYRLLESAFNEICLVMEYCETDLQRLFVVLPPQGEEEEQSIYGGGLDISRAVDDHPGAMSSTSSADSAGRGTPPRGLLDALHMSTPSTSSAEEGNYDTFLHKNDRRSLSSSSATPASISRAPPRACEVLRQLPVLRYVIRRILRMLHFLHHHCRVIHRDIKPSNFLVNAEGEIRLCDFGSSCFLWDEVAMQHTPPEETEEPMGARGPMTPTTFRTTRCYSSPESILGQPYDTKLDIWAAGVVFMELVLQRPLFTGSSELGVLSEIYDLLVPSDSTTDKTGNMADECPRVKKLEDHVQDLLPPEGVAFARHLLEVKPEERYTAQQALLDPFLHFSGWEHDDNIGETTLKKKLACLKEKNMEGTSTCSQFSSISPAWPQLIYIASADRLHLACGDGYGPYLLQQCKDTLNRFFSLPFSFVSLLSLATLRNICSDKGMQVSVRVDSYSIVISISPAWILYTAISFIIIIIYIKIFYLRNAYCTMSLYKVLDVPRTATAQEIRTAYRKKALEVHPDKCHGAEDLFLQLREAYDTLGDAAKRKMYDAKWKAERKKLVGFRRPPPLAEDPVAGVLLTLADDLPYMFETAPSVLRAGVTYGDVVGFQESMGTFVGLAGDHCWWWCKSGSDYPTKLCDPQSDMTRSSIKVLARGRYTTRGRASMRPPPPPPPPPSGPALNPAASRAEKQRKQRERELRREQAAAAPASKPSAASLVEDKQSELERMRQAILREGRKRVQADAKEVLMQDEKRLRTSRQNFLLEAQYLLHQQNASLKLRLAAGAGPTYGEWQQMMREARKPMAPFYPGESHHTVHLDPSRDCHPSSSSSTSTDASSNTDTTPVKEPHPTDKAESEPAAAVAAADQSSDTSPTPAACQVPLKKRPKMSGVGGAAPKAQGAEGPPPARAANHRWWVRPPDAQSTGGVRPPPNIKA